MVKGLQNIRKELRRRKLLWSEVIRKIFIKPGLEGEQDFSKVSGEDERMGITCVDEKTHDKCKGLEREYRLREQERVGEERWGQSSNFRRLSISTRPRKMLRIISEVSLRQSWATAFCSFIVNPIRLHSRAFLPASPVLTRATVTLVTVG